MKINRFVSLVIAISGPTLGSSALAAPPESPRPEDRPRGELRQLDQRDLQHRQTEPMGPAERTSKLIGSTVSDSAGEKFGKIRDLAVDLERGRVLQIIVASGGILGVGGKLIAMPPTALNVNASGDFTTGIDRKRIDDAPEFLADNWLGATQPDQVSAMYRYYEVEPRLVPRYWNQETDRTPGAVARVATKGTQGSVERASKIVGLPVTHESGKEVGKVDDLVVDLAAGRVTMVVVSTGGFLGVGDELSGIPPSLFRHESDRGHLVLQVIKETLQSAPRFKSSQWSEYATSNQFRQVYQAYGVKPYFDGSTEADNTRLNVRDRDDRTLTPLDQGNSDSDIKTTADIRRSVTREDGLSVTARNVKIITVNGRVTLRGPVNSVAEKDRIESLAKSIAGDGKVDSQLEVAPEDSNK